MLMSALQVTHPLSFKQIQIPIPQLPPGETENILVQTCWALTCGSDIPFFTGNKRFQTYPLAAGAPAHECTGKVIQSASGRFRPGDRVLAIPEGNQGLAEYFLAQADKCVLLDPDIEDLGAACLIQPLATVMSAMDRLGDIRGKSLAVIGLGSIGLLFVWLGHKRGAGTIIGIDPIAERCLLAEAMGATSTICRRSIEVLHDVRLLRGGLNSPDICIEAVGHQSDTLNDCFELVDKCGTILAFGVPDQPVYAFNYEVFFRKNAQLIAAVTPEWKTYLAMAHDLFRANIGELSGLVTHRLPMREAEKAFGIYERHEDGIIKAALDAEGW